MVIGLSCPADVWEERGMCQDKDVDVDADEAED